MGHASDAEAAAEAALSAATGDIVGIPRAEWLRLQAPARYLGNEWGAVHKPWGDATVRFALAYPEARSARWHVRVSLPAPALKAAHVLATA